MMPHIRIESAALSMCQRRASNGRENPFQPHLVLLFTKKCQFSFYKFVKILYMKAHVASYLDPLKQFIVKITYSVRTIPHKSE